MPTHNYLLSSVLSFFIFNCHVKYDDAVTGGRMLNRDNGARAKISTYVYRISNFRNTEEIAIREDLTGVVVSCKILASPTYKGLGIFPQQK